MKSINVKSIKLSKWLAVFVAVAIAWQAARAEEPQEGKVIAVGKDSITILDKVEGDNDMYLVDAATKITRQGKAAKLSDIQVGDRVKIIVGRPEKGKMVAKEITASSPE